MENRKIKEMFDACYQAKRIREMLPPLPKGVSSSYIQYLDVIGSLQAKGLKVKVSDVSESMNLPMPGVTRTLKEMERKGYLKKESSNEDKRITFIYITKKGEELSDTYDKYYFSELAPYMDKISQEEADSMIKTIEKFYQIMKDRRKENEW